MRPKLTTKTRSSSWQMVSDWHRSGRDLEVEHHAAILVLHVVTVDHVDLVSEVGMGKVDRDA